MNPHNFREGDRVVVESPVLKVVDDLMPVPGVTVGMLGTVTRNYAGSVAHADGDITVLFDGFSASDYRYVIPEGLLRVDDLPLYAANRMPKTAGRLGLVKGDTVTVKSGARWLKGDGTLGTDIGPLLKPGARYTIERTRGKHSIRNVRLRTSSGGTFDVLAEDVTKVAKSAPCNIGSSLVDHVDHYTARMMADAYAAPVTYSPRLTVLPPPSRADYFREARGLCGPDARVADVLEVARWLEEGKA